MFEKIIEQETKPREIHSMKDLSDLCDRILHSTGIEAESSLLMKQTGCSPGA